MSRVSNYLTSTVRHFKRGSICANGRDIGLAWPSIENRKMSLEAYFPAGKSHQSMAFFKSDCERAPFLPRLF